MLGAIFFLGEKSPKCSILFLKGHDNKTTNYNFKKTSENVSLEQSKIV
jgi:hypothetical protein